MIGIVKKRLIVGAIFLSSVIFALVAIEIILSVVTTLQFKDRYYPWPPYLSKVVTPLEEVLPGVDGQKRFYINSMGMRGDELSDHYQYKILAIGGSTTEEGALDESETWTKLLQNSLGDKSDIKVWVGNAGRRASNLRQNILHMKYFVPQLGKLDGMILLGGANDLMMSLEPSYKQKLTDLSVDATSSELDLAFFIHPYIKQGIKDTATWNLLKKVKVTVFGRKKIDDNEGSIQVQWRKMRQDAVEELTSLPDLESGLAEFEHNLNLIVDMARQKNMRVILLTQPSLWKADMPDEEKKLLWFGCVEKDGWRCFSPGVLAEGMDLFNKRMLYVCFRKEVECIDLASKLPKDTTIFYDDVHFNENGAREVAKVVFEYTNERVPFKN